MYNFRLLDEAGFPEGMFWSGLVNWVEYPNLAYLLDKTN